MLIKEKNIYKYCNSLTTYSRLLTREVMVGKVGIGGNNPIRIQSMTTTDTMDTIKTVEQSIRMIEAGCELVRITAPSMNEAQNLANIKAELRKRGYNTPIVADIHFTPNAAELAAKIVEKVRVNPGNYADKKKFQVIEYTDAEYNDELERIREKFTPLVLICKEHGTAMRIGTNHGSLSDRIMSRYGDSPRGMVESAMEFLRIARDNNFHEIVLSMKASNPQVMVYAYRLLVHTMLEELGECYPLHLGVTEAGDGEDGRIKSAIGIGTLLEDGLGDTIRVSLTEDPEFEIPVCKDIVRRYAAPSKSPPKGETSNGLGLSGGSTPSPSGRLGGAPFEYRHRDTNTISNIGGKHVPVVIADYNLEKEISHEDLIGIGYKYNSTTDKWNISDSAADYIYSGKKIPGFNLPGTLKVICDHSTWLTVKGSDKYLPLFTEENFLSNTEKSPIANFISINANRDYTLSETLFSVLSAPSANSAVVCLLSDAPYKMTSMRRFIRELMARDIKCPVIICVESNDETIDEQLIHFSTDAGALLLDGMGNGVWFRNNTQDLKNIKVSGRTYLEVKSNHQFLNNTSFSVLQATRTRISKTEYISCPSCGRTLFDLQETTAKIRSRTHHLKGVKIAIMGCIVNGPGEMADADYGYVGSGPGKITLYKGKEVVKRSVPSVSAVDELIQLIKDNGDWVE